MAEAKHPKNWKELGHANPMRDIFVEKLVRPFLLRTINVLICCPLLAKARVHDSSCESQFLI